MIAAFETWSTGIYRAINTWLSEVIAPFALAVKRDMQMRKARRDTKHAVRVARMLNFRIAGEEVVTVPNMLSAMRPLLILMILPMRLYGVPTWVIAIAFALAMFTDKLDGTWALLDGHTRFGEVLDPICDKIAFAIFIIPDLPHLPWMVMVPLLVCEAALFIIVIVTVYAIHLGVFSYEVKLTANIFGKVKFTIEVVAMSFLVFHAYSIAIACFAIATPFALASTIRKATDIVRSAPKTN